MVILKQQQEEQVGFYFLAMKEDINIIDSIQFFVCILISIVQHEALHLF